MLFIVVANANTQKELQDKQVPEGVVIKFITTFSQITWKADAYFYLLPEVIFANDKAAIELLPAPVFVNAVITLLNELPANCIRINAWPSFLLNPSLEVCASEQNKQIAAVILSQLKWKHSFVPDIVGMIAPRTIAMIINEAFFALGDEVSTREDIDIAMRLGTNYPHGPFGWANILGIKNIIDLLNKLCITDKRYIPAPLLAKEAEL
ncbi:MAG: hypothetical protein JWQ96_1087 [Segetibacter sp.]|nr:hypothetical protein [Segetibacter sp.]